MPHDLRRLATVLPLAAVLLASQEPASASVRYDHPQARTERPASFRVVRVPGFVGGTNVLANMQLTHEGVYLQVLGGDHTRTLRFEAGGSEYSHWSTWEPAFEVQHYTPVNATREREGVFSVYWTRPDPWGPDGKWGMYNLNTGTTSFTYEDDVRTITEPRDYLARIVPSSEEIRLRRDWAISQKGWVLVDDGTRRGHTRAASDVFTRVAKLPTENVEVAVGDPKGGAVYVGAAGRLYRVTSAGVETAADLSARGSMQFNKLVWLDGTLWIGYGNLVARLDGGTLSVVATIGNAPRLGQGSRFCVRGGSIYTTDGLRIDVYTQKVSPFLGDRNLITDPAERRRFDRISGAVASGVLDCSTRPTDQYLYVIDGNGTNLYEIVPLAS